MELNLSEIFKHSTFDTIVFQQTGSRGKNLSANEYVVECEPEFSMPPTEILSIERIKSVRFERFRSLDVSAIFAMLAEMKNLEELHFYHSEIKSIPTQIGLMKNLKRLTFEWDVSGSIKSWEMRKVPPEFGELENLSELNLLNCSSFRGGFPAESVKLRNLQFVKFVEDQSLRTLPENIESLSALKHLYFSSSKINPSNLEPLIDKIKTLKSITIDNAFYYFEETIKKYPHIKFYDDGIKFSQSLAQFENEPEKLPSIGEFLKVERSKKEEVEYALLIVKKHFALNRLKFKQRGVPTSMSSVSWDLYLNIDEFVRDGKHQTMLRNMLAELTDFCEAASRENFDYSLFVLFEKFVDRDPPRSKFVSLLPSKALGKFDKIDEIMDSQHESYMESLNQMGY